MSQDEIEIDRRNSERRAKAEELIGEILLRIIRDDRPIVIRFEETSSQKDEHKFDLNKQIIDNTSDIQNLKNLFNKYLKVEVREESVNQFKELIAKIEEIIEVYAHYEINETFFWIFYDKGDRIEILEKVVDVECDFENIFKDLNFDYRILPYSAITPQISSKEDLIYKREE